MLMVIIQIWWGPQNNFCLKPHKSLGLILNNPCPPTSFSVHKAPPVSARGVLQCGTGRGGRPAVSRGSPNSSTTSHPDQYWLSDHRRRQP